ncbi:MULTISPECIES: response regulator transcription factor [Actinoplanes]|uniref:response regulator n=1 Tax=Actinoplanes TaxID=1865 RepID=UPI0005F29A23|nr:MULTISPECIES: response regulator transcription factor [Actinoplanes]GLY04379.1 DNA-binding response regulator [Actinoplanes sp. NBRC 101535]
MIRVLLADDHLVIRTGFRTLLELDDEITVCGEAPDGAQAVALIREMRPDVVLMDIQMPFVDGIEATRRVTADPALKGVRIVALTTYEVESYVFGMLRAGACGFLTKNVRPDRLREAVHLVAAGESLLSPAATRALIAGFVDAPAARPVDEARLSVLTPREREVVCLVATGMTNEEIGAQLLMSPATARTHVGRAVSKLCVRDRAHLVAVAYESGLVRP